ncbi:MAG: outer membrane beta-barrel protein [Acidobacteriota bacterium]|nr:outer membrane beta-barrel protein [Acidobacteriota bacterium]
MTRARTWEPRFLPVTTSIALLAAALAATPAAAERGDVYVSAYFSLADVEVRSSGAFDQIIDGDENAVSYELGYRFHPNVGIEAGYHDLSKVDGAILPCAEGVPCSEIAIRGKFTGLTLAIAPRFEVGGRVGIFARAGLVTWGADIEDAADNLDVAVDDLDRGDTIFGFGADIRIIGGLSGVAKWESMGDIELVSVGLRLTF